METDSAHHPAIVLDSLTPLLLHSSAVRVCAVLHRLATLGRPLVSLCHTDLHDPSVQQALEHVTSTVVSVSPAKAGPGSGEGVWEVGGVKRGWGVLYG